MTCPFDRAQATEQRQRDQAISGQACGIARLRMRRVANFIGAIDGGVVSVGIAGI